MTAKEFLKADVWLKWPWKHLNEKSTTPAGTQNSKLFTFYYLWVYLKPSIYVLKFTKIFLTFYWVNLFLFENSTKVSKKDRKAGIRNQEWTQLPNTFRPRHQRERRAHLKQRRHSQNTTSRKPKGQFLSLKNGQTAIQNKKLTRTMRTYMPRHTMTEIVNHSRSTCTTLERSVKTLLGA